MSNNSYKYNSSDIEKMFDNISNRYDFMNNILSFKIHLRWKKEIIYFLKKVFTKGNILDIASGTGDMSILLAKNFTKCKIIGLDLSQSMINVGKKKVIDYGFCKKIKFIKGNVEKIPFIANYFDVITISFGIRNFERIDKSLEEIYRVLKKGGYIIILEFSKPRNFFIRNIFNLYSFYINKIASKISKYPKAYNYLTKSIKYFPSGKELENIICIPGFLYIQTIELTFGIASIYIAKK